MVSDKLEIVAQVPVEWYPVIGALVVSNIGLVASGITLLVRHLSEFSLMKLQIAKIEAHVSKMETDIDAAHDKMRTLGK